MPELCPSRHRTGVRLVAIGAALLLLTVSACSKSLGSPVAASRDDLITYDAEAGTWKPAGGNYELTMERVSQTTEVISDRDGHRREQFRTRTLIEGWAEIFGGDDPTAAVILTLEDGRTLTVMVVLSDPVLSADGADVTYQARPKTGEAAVLAALRADKGATLPAYFGPHSVVIDGGGAQIPSPTTAPATPATPAPPTTTPAAPATTVPGPPPGPSVPECTNVGAVGANPLKMSVVNTSSTPDNEVFVTLTGGTAAGYSGWTANPTNLINTSVPLACLPQDPTVPGGHGYYFQLSEGVAAGLLWVSYGAGLPGLPTTQPSFDTSTTRFANVEFAYPGQGDMTNVDQFSFPIDLDTYASPTAPPSAPSAESSHYNATTCEIVGALKDTVAAQGAAANWKQVVVDDPSGDFVRVLSPKQRAQQPATVGPQNSPNPYAQGWPVLQGYLDSMAGRTMTVEGLFSPGAGAPAYSETGWYQYTAVFDQSSNVTLNGTIQAPIGTKPGAQGSVAGEAITIQADGSDNSSPNSLLTGMYDQSSAYSVGSAGRNADGDPPTPDDVYNTIYRDFITAFTYGYWGGRYGTSNTGFWQSFDPPSSPAGGQPSFQAARSGTDPFTAFNVYAQTMFNYSNNYNIPYGEDYGSGAPGRPSPLMDLPVGGTLRMTIGNDGPTGCLDGF